MRIWRVAVALVPLALSCRDYRPDPKLAPPSSPAPTTPAAARAPVPEWLPVDFTRGGDSLAPSAGDPDGGVLVQGQRIAKSGPSSQLATAPLLGGARVPKHLGGGFLFWGTTALYFAKTFLADLEPIVAVEAGPVSVSFGPGYTIVHQNNGGRLALSWPAKRSTALPVAALVDVGTSADGRSALLIEPDLVLTRGAGHESWRDMTAEARIVSRLYRSDSELWLERKDGTAARVEADGSLSMHGRVPTEISRPRVTVDDPRWPRSVQETPLSRAVRRGVPLDDHRVVVEVAGAFATVDLGTGELTHVTSAVLASARECELLPMSSDVLALCRLQDATQVVISGAGGSSPKIEHAFSGPGSFFVGSPGTLLFGGACDGRANDHPLVCVRQRDGSWRELGPPPGPRAGDAGPTAPPPAIARWVPTADGRALGLVGGQAGGVYDPVTGAIAPFSTDPRPQEAALFSPRGQLVTDDVALAQDGRFVGYVGTSAMTLGRDGSIEHSPQRFVALVSSGALALAQDPEHRLWQSTDFGRHWLEVGRPPGSTPGQSYPITLCSRVGCELSGWFRIGYRTSPTRTAPVSVAPHPGLAPAARLPRLVCDRTSPPRTRWTTRSRNAEGEMIEEFDFGARKVRARDGSLTSILLRFEAVAEELALGATFIESDLADPTSTLFRALVGRPRTLRFVDLFGDAKVVESRFSWQDVLTRAARESGGVLDAPDREERYVVPVLGERPYETTGLSLRDSSGALLWLRGGQAASVLGLGRENAGFEPISAIAKGKSELVVLSEDDSCSARVLAVTPAGARTLLELPARPTQKSCPANPDALAHFDDGSFGVLRMPSTGPPTSSDPALALKPRSKPVSLAPWSTLTACGADAKGLRATITIPSRWVTLEAPGLADATEAYTLAIVRWSETRVCAESLAIAAPPVQIGDEELATTVVARFGTRPRADRRGFALGAEHTEDLTCKLAP